MAPSNPRWRSSADIRHPGSLTDLAGEERLARVLLEELVDQRQQLAVVGHTGDQRRFGAAPLVLARTPLAGLEVLQIPLQLGQLGSLPLGSAGQQRWQQALDGLDVLWVGVRCDGTVAAGREIARGDRVPGMAASQAEVVHQGVFYDVEVDTTHTEALACARAIAGHVS